MTQADTGLFQDLLVSFRYATQGDGLYILCSGAVVFTIGAHLAVYASILGILIQIGIAGYVASYAKDVVRTSAMGQDLPPGWVDFSDWMGDIVIPAFQFLLAAVLAFGFMSFLQFKRPFHGGAQTAAFLLSAAWGCSLLPILTLGLAMTDSAWGMLNPIPLARAVWLTLSDYVVTCLFCMLMVGLGVGLGFLQGLVVQVPILPEIVGWFLSLYLTTTLMRGIGLLYRTNHERLQWY